VAVRVVVEVLGLALLTAVVAPVAPAAASAMAQLNGWGAWFVASCARGFGSLPGAQSRLLARPRSSGWGQPAQQPMLGGVASERELKPCYLLTGSDRPKIALALQRLRGRIGAEATEQLAASEASGEDAVAACNALGLFGGEARLVVVDGVEAWKAADVKEVESYLASPAPATVLALVGEGVKRDSALAKAVGKAGDLLVYDVEKKQLPEWVAEQLVRLGTSADRDACRTLVEAVGDDVGDIASEIQKLATWANGEQITRVNVEQLAVGRAETPIFAVTDAWGRRDVAATLRATESLLERSHRPRSGELMRLVALLVGHVGRVRKVSRLADEGVRTSEIAGRLKIHPFVAEKAAKQAGNFSPDELARVTVRLAELDASSKGGSRLPAELQLERALVEITHRPA
jgi:DNA polymerase III subunit delta